MKNLILAITLGLGLSACGAGPVNKKIIAPFGCGSDQEVSYDGTSCVGNQLSDDEASTPSEAAEALVAAINNEEDKNNGMVILESSAEATATNIKLSFTMEYSSGAELLPNFEINIVNLSETDEFSYDLLFEEDDDFATILLYNGNEEIGEVNIDVDARNKEVEINANP